MVQILTINTYSSKIQRKQPFMTKYVNPYAMLNQR